MCSAARATPASELRAAVRIRDAALELFGRHGTKAVSVRAIAERADVSPPLVIHHYGSKAGLIEAVDDHLLDRVASYLDEFTTRSGAEEAKSVLVSMADEPALFAYLPRALAEGGAAGTRLFDRLHQKSMDVIDTMIAAGLCRPIEDRAALATLLLVEDLGVMLLRGHVQRTLGVDPYSPEGLARLAAVDLEIKTHPLITYPSPDPASTDEVNGAAS